MKVTDVREGETRVKGDLSGVLRSEEWALTQRIVASPRFARSALLTSFLLYVCDRKLRGREDEINEFEVGIQALGRPPTFHPGEDNIVRTYARMLRKRLEEYFNAEGRNEPTHITIPRGQYIPVFEAKRHVELKRDLLKVEVAQVSDIPEVEKLATRAISLRPIWAIAGLVIVILLVTSLYRLHRAISTDLYGQFWASVFDPKRPTFVVTGDSGFAMLQDITGRDVHLNEYVSGDITNKFSAVDAFSRRKNGTFGADRYANYTSIADLNSVVELTRLPQFTIGQVKIRYARDLRMEDLKQANVILFGGPHANPWVELFEPSSAFRMIFPSHLDGMDLDERSIINKNPRVGEQENYTNLPTDMSHKTYTVLSYLPSVDGIGHALLLEGENMAGTHAAADFVMNESLMQPILQKSRLKDGSIGSFELLLETHTVGASSPEAKVLVERYEMSTSLNKPPNVPEP